MIDTYQPLYRQIVALLDPIGLPVFTFVPDEQTEPFIYVQVDSTQQVDNKCNFETEGTVTVQLYISTINADGSIKYPLEVLAAVRQILQPNVNFKLDLSANGIGMVYWKMFNDTGLYLFNPDERQYVSSIQYEYRISQEITTVDKISDIIHVTDDVVYNLFDLIHIDFT